MKHCRNLTFLSLDIHDVKPSESNGNLSYARLFETIKEGGVSLSSLHLGLEKSRITFETLEVLAERVAEMKQLTSLSLNLKANHIGDEGCASIRGMLGKMT